MLHDKNNTLHQTSSTMQSFLVALPFVLHGLVDEDNEHLLFLLQLVQIYKIIISSVFTYATLEKMKILIRDHLQKFTELFKDCDLIPKQHFMIHFPSIIEKHGPPVIYNTARFENNHQDPKKKVIARQNYINVPKSVCDSEVRQEAVEIKTSAEDHILFNNSFCAGKLNPLKDNQLQYFKEKARSFCNLDIHLEGKVVHNTKQLSIGSLKIITDYTFVAVEAKDDKLFFGLVKHIYVINKKNTFLEIKMFDSIGLKYHLNACENNEECVEI